MRISDWSSDVCSSDLSDERGGIGERERAFIGDEGQRPLESVEIGFAPAPQRLFELRDAMLDKRGQQAGERRAVIALIGIDADPRVGPRGADRRDAQYILVEVAGQIGRGPGGGRVCLQVWTPGGAD